MNMLANNDTLRNSPIKEEKHIIYSVSWHPTEKLIALSGNIGLLMIYDAMKQKLISTFKDNTTPSFKCAWN